MTGRERSAMAWLGKRGAEAETQAEPEPGSDAQAEPEPGPDAQAEPEPGPDAQAEPEPGPEADAEATAAEPVAARQDVPVRVVSTPVVSLPQPMDADAGEAGDVVALDPGSESGAAVALANVPEMTWVMPTRPAPAPDGTRTPLQEELAKIAEGLRQHGPIPLNPGGPGPAPR